MTSAVARVDFHWFSFLLRSSHSTMPSIFAFLGSSSRSVRRANACVSIVSLYQSHERSSGAQNVPCSSFVFAESITDAHTRSLTLNEPQILAKAAEYRAKVSASLKVPSEPRP